MRWVVTIGKFIEVATTEFGAELRTTTGVLTGPRGVVRPRYLYREENGVARFVALPEADEDIVAPNVLRGYCRQLGIDPGRFQLGGRITIRYPDDEPEDD